MKRIAEKLFGDIPTGPAVPRLQVTPAEAVSRRLVLEDRVELPRVYLLWPSPPLFSADDAALDVAADVMANGRTSRLYRTLIHDRRRAAELGAAQGSRELGSLFQVVATAAPEVSLDELRQAIIDEVTRLATEGPSPDELERSRVQAESAFMSRLQTLGGFGGKADQLNAYNVYTGSPSFFADDLQRYLRLTPADIQQAVARWLDPQKATMLSVVPTGKLDLALADSRPATVTT